MKPDKLNAILKRVYESDMPDVSDLEALLGLQDSEELGVLFDFADNIRQKFVGDGVLLRGLVEFSNFCRNSCLYCGLNKYNKALKRYCMSHSEILSCVEKIAHCGIKTVVLQSGEDDRFSVEALVGLIKDIKNRYDMAVTLSVGEADKKDYQLFKDAGADRFLLKIEASQKQFYDRFHPEMDFENRIRCLGDLKQLGYQTGCGNLVGLKGQTIKILAEDILFFKRENFDMIGIGLFIPHKRTELGSDLAGDLDMALKVLALTRIVTKIAHLPAATAIGTKGGEDAVVRALKAGANVIMPNFTPTGYKELYEIYPGKKCVTESWQKSLELAQKDVKVAGRYIDYSRGDSLKNKVCSNVSVI